MEERKISKEGDITPIFNDDGTIEGYAQLIERVGEPYTFSQDESIYKMQRWLIEWVALKEHPDIRSKHDFRLSHRFLEGKRTHRSIPEFVTLEKGHYNLKKELRQTVTRWESSKPKQEFYKIDRFIEVTINGITKEIY